MTKIKTVTYRLPSYWGSAMVNGDYSGLSDDDEKEINELIKNKLNKYSCFYCFEVDDDSNFDIWRGKGCDLSTFHFIIN